MVSSDDMKNYGTSEKFLVKQDQTDSEDGEDTIPGLHSGFIVKMLYNEKDNLNKLLIFWKNFALIFCKSFQ